MSREVCGVCFCPYGDEGDCACQPAQQQDIDWKDQYEKQKRRAEMWIAKYEADIGPLEKAGPVTAQQPAQQAPAGSVYRYGKDSSGKPWHGIRWTASGLDLPDGTLIYTSPPARKPLTEDEIKEGRTLRWNYEPDEQPEPWAFRMGVKWAEEKHGIKEKNYG